jgi:hypothetical protein
VNKFLQNEANGGMKGLSAKVFRTYNASTTFQGLLDQTAENLKASGLEATPQTLKDQYHQANRLVAILCNHQKTLNPILNQRAQERHEQKVSQLALPGVSALTPAASCSRSPTTATRSGRRCSSGARPSRSARSTRPRRTSGCAT